MIYFIGIIIILIVITLYFFIQPVKKKEEISIKEKEIDEQEKKEYYVDAPKPNLDPEEVFKLWPDLAKKMEVDQEKIDQEWIDFARKYPNNFYIPTKYLNLTEKQKEERIKELENFADIESRIASLKSKLERDSKVGIDGPEAPEKPNLAPEEQKAYFSYKIRELESRIQLIEYWLENQNINPEQKNNAEEEIKQWKKELSEYQSLLKQIP